MTAFSRKSLEFLIENRLNDSRNWFLEHHGQYEEWVLEPLRNLSQGLASAALSIDPEFITEPRVGKTLSRIRRDTRFTHDKSLYRDHMWVLFRRGKDQGSELPAIFIEISPQGLEYGCGFYCCSTSVMAAAREMILEGHPLYRKAKRALGRQDVFSLEGDFYKRPHYPDSTPADREWLERRNLLVRAHSTDETLIYSENLADLLSQDLALLKPIYQFLLEACRKAHLSDETKPVLG